MNVCAGAGLFVGRESELARLTGLVEQVTAGHGAAAWLEGEQGIGKTTLLAQALAAAEAAGCRVLRGSGDELAPRFPLQAMTELIGQAAKDPATRPAVAGDPVLVLAERQLAWVERLCAEAPVVLVFDDAQWADDASVALLARLGRLAEQAPLLLVVATRSGPRPPGLSRLRRSLASRELLHLRLRQLPFDLAVELVEGLLGASPGPKLRELTLRAGGNPLCVHELVTALRREDRLTADGPAGVELLGEVAAPDSLVTAMAERMEFLSAATREALGMAALLGQDFAVLDLATITGAAVAELIPVAEEGTGSGVLVESPAGLRFRNKVLWRACYERIPAAVRTGLHQHAAEALLAAGAPAERIGGQLVRSRPEAMTPAVLDWLDRAGADLRRRAPRIARELLADALNWVPADDPRRERLEGGLIAVLGHLARHEEVVLRATVALARTTDTAYAEWLTWSLGRSLLALDRVGEAYKLVASAPAPGGRWRARLRALNAEVLLGQARSDGVACAEPAGMETPGDGDAKAYVLAEAERAVKEAETAGDAYAKAYALWAQCRVDVPRNGPAARLALTERASTLSSDDPEFAEVRLTLARERARALHELTRDAEAHQVLADALDFAERTAMPQGFPMRADLAALYYFAGSWDDATAEADAVLENLAGLPDRVRLEVRCRGLRALIAARRNERDLAVEQLAAVSQGSDAVFATTARAVLAEQRGEVGEALDLLAAAIDVDDGEDRAGRWAVLPFATRLALAVGDEPFAKKLAAGSPSGSAAAQVCRGLVESDPALLLAADVTGRKQLRPVEVAEATENAAVVCGRAGDVARARELLADAVDAFGGFGAGWDVARCEARLRVFGVRLGVRGRRSRGISGWAALTRTELRVAGLVAGGLSNPEIAAELFLSPRTVQTHVSHILGKLGVRSRVEIAAEAARHDS